MKELLRFLGGVAGLVAKHMSRRKPAPSPPARTIKADTDHIKAPSPAVTLPKPPVAKRGRRALVVGVDFGTSTTKVICNESREETFEVFRWNESSGIDSALLPSTLCISDGALHFGKKFANSSAAWIRSIKLCMLCARNNRICRCQNAIAENGLVRLPGVADPIRVDLIAAMFLAWVFRKVEDFLVERFSNDDLMIVWNVGCPMDHLDAAKSKEAWEQVVGTAMELRQDASNPTPLTFLTKAAEVFEDFYVPLESERSYAVQPEGLAAVKAFLESPQAAASKSYAIVDVGAGTTEISFFFNGLIMSEGGITRPSYLADSTKAIGGGKIDMELSEAWGCTLDEARARKESGRTTLPNLDTIQEIKSQYRRTCMLILKENKLKAPNDKHFDLFVIGGSGRLAELRAVVEGEPLAGGFSRDQTRVLEPPKGLRSRGEFAKDYDLLANACGLASAIGWQYYPPKDVCAMAATVVGVRDDRDELYPK